MIIDANYNEIKDFRLPIRPCYRPGHRILSGPDERLSLWFGWVGGSGE
jgi:hypothetical protein